MVFRHEWIVVFRLWIIFLFITLLFFCCCQVTACHLVLFFDCSEAVMEERLIKRGMTSGRVDDNADTIRKRFNTFTEETLPVIQSYEKKNKLKRVWMLNIFILATACIYSCCMMWDAPCFNSSIMKIVISFSVCLGNIGIYVVLYQTLCSLAGGRYALCRWSVYWRMCYLWRSSETSDADEKERQVDLASDNLVPNNRKYNSLKNIRSIAAVRHTVFQRHFLIIIINCWMRWGFFVTWSIMVSWVMLTPLTVTQFISKTQTSISTHFFVDHSILEKSRDNYVYSVTWNACLFLCVQTRK